MSPDQFIAAVYDHILPLPRRLHMTQEQIRDARVKKWREPLPHNAGRPSADGLPPLPFFVGARVFVINEGFGLVQYCRMPGEVEYASEYAGQFGVGVIIDHTDSVPLECPVGDVMFDLTHHATLGHVVSLAAQWAANQPRETGPRLHLAHRIKVEVDGLVCDWATGLNSLAGTQVAWRIVRVHQEIAAFEKRWRDTQENFTGHAF